MVTSWWDEPVEIANVSTTPAEWLRKVWITLSDAEIVDAFEQYGISTTAEAVTQKRQAMRLKKTRSGIPLIFEDGGTKKYNKPPIIKSDNVLVMADVHAPYHDVEWCSEVVYIAKHLSIKDCIIDGDLFDFTALSSFAKFITIEEDNDDLSEEIESAADFVSALLSNFERIVYTLGNHEKRLSRSAGVKVRTSLIRTLLGQRLDGRNIDAKRIKIEPYYYSVIKSSTGKWRITHPKNSSVTPVRVAARLADKYQMHVIAGHGHDWGCITSVSGYYAAACGVCCDVVKLDYVQLEDNLRPVMQQGAWMLVDGKPVLLHPEYGGMISK